MRNLIFIAIFVVYSVFSCEANARKESLHYKSYTPNPFTIIHVLTIDPKQVKIVSMRAQDIGQGLAKVENIAKRFNAIAAINGGFFRLDEHAFGNGLPAGVLKIDNVWHGIAYQARGAIAWDPNSNDALIDVIQTDSKIILQNQTMQINSMNKLVTGNRAALLSDSYTNVLDVVNSTAIVIVNSRVNSIYNTGKIVIPAAAYIYNISGTLQEKVKHIKPNDSAVMQVNIQPKLDRTTTKKWNNMPFIVGGGPILINKGKINPSFNKEYLSQDFINNRYARTAVGILPDKRWVLVVVERNTLQNITGLSIAELADFMHSLGCVDALNLDGGGSSAMYVAANKQNLISLDLVADALLVLPKS